MFMAKFIACEDGSYVNIDQIEQIVVEEHLHFHVVADDGRREWVLCKLETEKEAQEWLDKFMEKHNLCIEPIKQNRCF